MKIFEDGEGDAGFDGVTSTSDLGPNLLPLGFQKNVKKKKKNKKKKLRKEFYSK